MIDENIFDSKLCVIYGGPRFNVNHMYAINGPQLFTDKRLLFNDRLHECNL